MEQPDAGEPTASGEIAPEEAIGRVSGDVAERLVTARDNGLADGFGLLAVRRHAFDPAHSMVTPFVQDPPRAFEPIDEQTERPPRAERRKPAADGASDVGADVHAGSSANAFRPREQLERISDRRNEARNAR